MENFKIYCPGCGEAVEFIVESMRKGKEHNKPWADILCGRCHLVIATLEGDKEGVVLFSIEDKQE